MSAIIVLTVAIPAAAAAWPVIVSAGGALGFAAARKQEKQKGLINEIELALNPNAVAGEADTPEEVVLEKEGVRVAVCRDLDGRVSARVSGADRSDEELEQIGRRLIDGLTQQYAYHRLLTELKQRNFNVVEEEVEADGTVRLKVRVHQG